MTRIFGITVMLLVVWAVCIMLLGIVGLLAILPISGATISALADKRKNSSQIIVRRNNHVA